MTVSMKTKSSDHRVDTRSGSNAAEPSLDPVWEAIRAEVAREVEREPVLASSLHALVIAEAYGIPARYVRLSESEALFKYRDYYQGTGRCEFKFATNLEQGLEMGGAPPPVFDPQRLIDAFPIDLWQVGSERRSFAGAQLNGVLHGRH